MNKNELIKNISKESNLSRKDCANCLNAMMQVIKNTLQQGDTVNLIGFGKFEVRNKASRIGYNPVDKIKFRVPSCKIPAFKAGKGLKQAIS